MDACEAEQRQQTHPYGFGWGLGEVRGHRIIEHGGSWQGFKAFIARFPDDGLSVILFANLSQANEWRLARGIAAVFFPELALGAAPLPGADPAVTQLARRVLRQLLAGAPDPQLFTAEARAALSPRRVRALAARLTALNLPEALVASLELVGRSEEGGLRVYRYALTDITATEILILRVAADGRISGLDLQPE